MSDKQKALKAKHGTLEEFEAAIWLAESHLFCTHDEALAAINKYRTEWNAA